MVINDDTLGGGFIANPNYNPKSKNLKLFKVLQLQQYNLLELISLLKVLMKDGKWIILKDF